MMQASASLALDVETTQNADAMDDFDLLERSKDGDHDAFGALVLRHQKRIWLVCRQYLRPEEADEACQESFIKAYTNISRFDGRAALTTWLTRIAINTCLDTLRKRKREGLRITTIDDNGPDIISVIPDDRTTPERLVEERQAITRLKELENALPDRQRQIFRLRFYAEMDLNEIATSLSVHIGTVKTQLHRAVHRLRMEMGELR